MMRPDVKIAIAYGSNAQGEVADILRKKLLAYQKQGYPVSISIVKEDINNLEKNLKTRKEKETAIAEMMEKYFSDFDYAIFLFDTKGIAIPEGDMLNKIINNDVTNADTLLDNLHELVKKSPLISSNLIFEYGLASSAFINQELKTIHCFAPVKIETEALEYIKSLNFKYFNELLKERANDIDAQTDLIIQDYIHCNKYNQEGIYFSFYGLPEILPPLTKNGDTYILNLPKEKKTFIDSPMDETESNHYWADLNKLQPSGIRISLDEQDKALNKLFKTEYERFGNAEENQSEHIGRKLLYLIDRAVLIMYVSREYKDWEKWDTIVNALSENITSDKQITNKDYYIKSIEALKGVFEYQKCTYQKKLLDNLDKIEKQLDPISKVISGNGNRIGNPMIYCMAVDYLALVYHKKAIQKLGKIIGKPEFYFDNHEHHILLRKKLGKKNEELINSINQIIKLFSDAILLFEKVVNCQIELQKQKGEPRYNWVSFALYNQSRCEFAIYLISKLYKYTTLEISDYVKDKIEQWDKDMREAVDFRYQDYQYFKDKELFPQIITFNIHAEYYHAFYEYELSCLIAKQLNPKFNKIEIPINEPFEKWKNDNLNITDVLSVDGKVERLKKLKSQVERIPFSKSNKKTDWTKRGVIVAIIFGIVAFIGVLVAIIVGWNEIRNLFGN